MSYDGERFEFNRMGREGDIVITNTEGPIHMRSLCKLLNSAQVDVCDVDASSQEVMECIQSLYKLVEIFQKQMHQEVVPKVYKEKNEMDFKEFLKDDAYVHVQKPVESTTQEATRLQGLIDVVHAYVTKVGWEDLQGKKVSSVANSIARLENLSPGEAASRADEITSILTASRNNWGFSITTMGCFGPYADTSSFNIQDRMTKEDVIEYEKIWNKSKKIILSIGTFKGLENHILNSYCRKFGDKSQEIARNIALYIVKYKLPSASI